jgi:hypothetical protein
MQSPTKMAVLLLAAILLGGCTAAIGGAGSGAGSGSDNERDAMSQEVTATVSEDGVPPAGDATPASTETATFALG